LSEEILQRGSVDDKVAQLQKALYAIGFNPNEFNGFFGPGTEAAVKAFQEATKLTPTGVVDKQTWDYILRTTWTSTPEPVTLYRNPENPYQRHLLPDVDESKS
jgi:peptidoglycan hydrolase-like protein with peptidoglycan-binding domain